MTQVGPKEVAPKAQGHNSLFDTIKKHGKILYEKAIDIAHNEKIQQASRFANAVVETYFYVDRENPLSVGAGLASLWASGVDAFGSMEGPIHKFISRKKLKFMKVAIPRILDISGILDEYKPKVLYSEEDAGTELVVVNLPCGDIWYTKGTQSQNNWLNNWCYIEEGYDFEKLFDLIWSKYPTGIFLPRLTRFEDDIDYTLSLTPLETSELCYVGENPSLPDVVDELRRFRDKGISRSFLFGGDPGCGKTAFSMALARSFSNRILKMDPSGLEAVDAAYLEFLFENLKPDFIIFDDFDRTSKQETLLFAVENLKHKYPKATIIATVNDFSELDHALVRPGRFDGSIWFPIPKTEERKKILQHYIDKYEVKVSKAKLSAIVADTDGLTGAYLKDLCLRMNVLGPDKHKDIVAKYRKILAIHNKSKKDITENEEDFEQVSDEI